MTDAALLTLPVTLKGADPLDYRLTTTPPQRDRIAADLGLTALRKLSGRIRLYPDGARDWKLDGSLGATVVQPCVVTLEPVTTRIDTHFSRRFVANFEMPETSEAEMPEDDTIEPLQESLDLAEILIEALAIALPDYPRSDGAEMGAQTFAQPGVTPMSDEDAKPFAGLAALRDKLSNPQGPES